MVSYSKVKLFAIILIAILLLNSCSTTSEKLLFSMPSHAVFNPALNNQNVWPRAPLVARYLYIGDLRGESNKSQDKQKVSGILSRFFSAIAGLDSSSRDNIDLMRPQQGVVDNNGRVYIVDAGRRAVFSFDEKKSEFFIWDEINSGLPFKSPVGIAIVEDLIMVTDSAAAKIFVLNTKGQLLSSFGDKNLKRPTGIVYDKNTKRIFVSDTANNNIKIYNIKGVLLETFGQRGSALGDFNRPTFLSFKKNKLYVADSLNARIQIFNSDGEVINSIGKRGLYIGNFSRPKGIAVDSHGNIYVTESFYDYLLVFNPAGELLLSIGGSGQQAGQFSQPTAVWVDDSDRVFVSDMLNGRVSIFQYLGGT
ncbi:NHL repeat domain protein [hydrothermal vent metagenome]|uniref:NHL repeat domain protein n=1 Tax=hydrothermal vent metagenome TaxID=652676 RepID=A0A3B1AT72_9ZZZZ